MHLIAHAGALDDEMVRSVMEARRLLLSESARLAAARRSDEQAALLASLAEQLAAAEDGEAAQHLDFAFFAVLIQAAGNVVFLLVMNSIRALYLENLELSARSSSTGDAYAATPRARWPTGDADAAAATIAALAAAQEARLLP